MRLDNHCTWSTAITARSVWISDSGCSKLESPFRRRESRRVKELPVWQHTQEFCAAHVYPENSSKKSFLSAPNILLPKAVVHGPRPHASHYLVGRCAVSTLPCSPACHGNPRGHHFQRPLLGMSITRDASPSLGVARVMICLPRKMPAGPGSSLCSEEEAQKTSAYSPSAGVRWASAASDGQAISPRKHAVFRQASSTSKHCLEVFGKTQTPASVKGASRQFSLTSSSEPGTCHEISHVPPLTEG